MSRPGRGKRARLRTRLSWLVTTNFYRINKLRTQCLVYSGQAAQAGWVMFKMQLSGLWMQHLAAWPRQISLSSFLTPFNFIILWSHHKRGTIVFTRLCLNPLSFSFPILLIYGRQSHIFTQHNLCLYALAKLVCQTHKQTAHMWAQDHKCFHSVHFPSLLTPDMLTRPCPSGNWVLKFNS